MEDEFESKVWDALKAVKFPGMSRDIVSFGFVHQVKAVAGTVAVGFAVLPSDAARYWGAATGPRSCSRQDRERRVPSCSCGVSPGTVPARSELYRVNPAREMANSIFGHGK